MPTTTTPRRGDAPDPAYLDSLVTQSPRVQTIRKAIFAVADQLDHVVDRCRLYVDGLANLPRDGRFLLVGNHTSSGLAEIVTIPYFVHRELGVRVRGLANRSFGELGGPARDLLDAAGAVVGHPTTGAALMQHGETVLVFPGGGPDMLKFKGEEYQLRWEGRSGFARLAIAHEYPIVPVGLVGGDDVYRSLVTRNGRWERWSRPIGERLHGVGGVGIPIARGLGPTLIPRPQRMYLRFGSPIDTAPPADVDSVGWEAHIKDRTQVALETVLADLQELREADPFRNLSPVHWSRAVLPPESQPSGGPADQA